MNNRKLSENFNLNEFIYSDTAVRLGIKNTPTLLDVVHLEELCRDLLQPLRDYLGVPLNISSGYRCPKLNVAIGGVGSSAHQFGYACDITTPKGMNFEEFVERIKQFVFDCNPMFDQIIVEKTGKKRWIHIAIRNNAGKQRRQLFEIN